MTSCLNHDYLILFFIHLLYEKKNDRHVHNSNVYVVKFASTCIISVYMYRGCRGGHRISVGYTTTYAINIYHEKGYDFESHS
jgi:hypothetical protein